MKHNYLDEFAHHDGVLQKLDPRVKLASAVILVFAIVLAPAVEWEEIMMYFSATIALAFLGRIPARSFLARIAIPLPFIIVLLAGSLAGGVDYEKIVFAGAKSLASIAGLMVFLSTTYFADFLSALSWARAPTVFILLLAFLYRYSFIIYDEMLRVKMARRARGGRFTLRALGATVGFLFARSYERSERVYAAMTARGFSGEVKTTKRGRLSALDVLFTLFFVSFILGVSLI